ncbi:hypothetical protein F4781DRAFT_407155 [Annulohypoxylon bovei var. microspora]|nr:hypothetical protein F4781DRAFT_407155 [Annulohypoxylon bovei var. microspora]
MLHSTDEINPNINFFFEHRLRIQEHMENTYPHSISQQGCNEFLLPICASCRDDSSLLSPRRSPRISKISKLQRVRNTNRSHHSKMDRSITSRTNYGEDDGENLMKTGVRCEKLMILSEPFAMEGTTSVLIPPNEEGCHLNFLSKESIEYAMENHGIRNLTLYGLGVALLQIGLWDSIPWEDHVQVRRKVARLSWLGKRYRNATKKLINCDFGLATEELRDRSLQSAIFRDMIGDLEQLLSICELT